MFVCVSHCRRKWHRIFIGCSASSLWRTRCSGKWKYWTCRVSEVITAIWLFSSTPFCYNIYFGNRLSFHHQVKYKNYEVSVLGFKGLGFLCLSHGLKFYIRFKSSGMWLTQCHIQKVLFVSNAAVRTSHLTVSEMLHDFNRQETVEKVKYLSPH